MKIKNRSTRFGKGLIASAALMTLQLMNGVQAAGYGGQDAGSAFEIAAFGGGKLLNKNDWSPAENQYEFGGEIYYQPAQWPFGVTAGYLYSRGSGTATFETYDIYGDPIYETTDFTASTQEFQLGLKKYWHAGRVGEPFLEGGATYGSAKGSVPGYSDSDHGLGGWIGGGFMFHLARHWSIGPRLDYSYYKVTVADYDTSGGGLHIGALAAFKW